MTSPAPHCKYFTLFSSCFHVFWREVWYNSYPCFLISVISFCFFQDFLFCFLIFCNLHMLYLNIMSFFVCLFAFTGWHFLSFWICNLVSVLNFGKFYHYYFMFLLFFFSFSYIPVMHFTPLKLFHSSWIICFVFLILIFFYISVLEVSIDISSSSLILSWAMSSISISLSKAFFIYLQCF